MIGNLPKLQKFPEDYETQIKTTMRKTSEEREDDLRKALENVMIVAKTFGSRGGVKEADRAAFATAALDTIRAMATVALIGGCHE
jgi:hypothetical protein